MQIKKLQKYKKKKKCEKAKQNLIFIINFY